MSTKKRNSFYIQGTILAAASVISRFIGIAFRVPVKKILGSVGYGAYCNAYEIYNIALLLSTFSIPLAISRLVSAKEKKKEYLNSFKIFKCGLLFSGTVGLIMSVLVFVFADFLAAVIKAPSCAIPLKTLAPTIAVFSVMGVFRGFFQGKNTMIPTSISQILEQIVHVVCGLIFASMFMRMFSESNMSYAFGAAGATLGTLAGAIAAFIFLLAIYIMYRPVQLKRLKKDNTKKEDSYSTILKLIVATVSPIILNQVLYSITGNIDSVLLNNILREDEETRQILWGQYSGEFRLLANIPLAIASAIGVAVIPNVVSAITSGNTDDVHVKIHEAVKLNMIIAIPSAFGLIALGGPILNVMFNDNTAVGNNLMLIGSMSVVFFAYSTTTNSILQGMGEMRYPVLHALIGIIVYTLVDFPLLMYSNLGIYSLAIGYMVFPFTVGVLNWIKLASVSNYRQEIIKTFLLPSVFSAIMAVIAYYIYEGTFLLVGIKLVSLIAAILVAVIVYFVLMITTHTLSLDEIREFPMGTKIAAILKKTGIKESKLR